MNKQQFRIYDTYNGVMIHPLDEPYKNKFSLNMNGMVEFRDGDVFFRDVDGSRYFVLRCAEVEDKNGVLMFEGDTVRFYLTQRQAENLGEEYIEFEVDMYTISDEDYSQLEIVGNKYEGLK